MESYFFMTNVVPQDEYPRIGIQSQEIDKLQWIYHATHIKYVQSIVDKGLYPTHNVDSHTPEIVGNYFYVNEPSIDQYQLGCKRNRSGDEDDCAIVFKVHVPSLDNTAFLIDVTDGYSRQLWEFCNNDFDSYVAQKGALIYTKHINSNLLEIVGCHNCKHGLKPDIHPSLNNCPSEIINLFIGKES